MPVLTQDININSFLGFWPVSTRPVTPVLEFNVRYVNFIYVVKSIAYITMIFYIKSAVFCYIIAVMTPNNWKYLVFRGTR